MKKQVYYHSMISSEPISFSEPSGIRLTTICRLIVSSLSSLTSQRQLEVSCPSVMLMLSFEDPDSKFVRVVVHWFALMTYSGSGMTWNVGSELCRGEMMLIGIFSLVGSSLILESPKINSSQGVKLSTSLFDSI